jgi:transcriptional regulator with XRE-family HTH domain
MGTERATVDFERTAGSALRRLREDVKRSQVEIAGLVRGLDQGTLSRWERGDDLRRFPQHARALANVLGPEVHQIARTLFMGWVLRTTQEYTLFAKLGAALGQIINRQLKEAPQEPVAFVTIEQVAQELGQPVPADAAEREAWFVALRELERPF